MSRAVFPRVQILVVLTLLFSAVVLADDRAFGGESSDLALAQSLGNPSSLDPVLSALADRRLVRHVAGPQAGHITLPPVPFGFGLTGDQLPPLDVTATMEAKHAVDEFVARLRDRGIDGTRTQWRVFTLPPVQEAVDAASARGVSDDDPLGSRLIVPAGTAVKFVGAVFQDGELYVKTTVSAAAMPQTQPVAPKGFSAMAVPSDSVSFVPSGGVGCLDRKQNSTAHYDPCQLFWQALNDGSGATDWFASEMHGTGKSHSIWTLSGLEVDSRATKGTARQDWVDWDPGADARTNCQSQSVSVSYGGASVSVDKQHCELWDIDKGAEAFDMSNWWRGDVWREERSTAAVTLTKVRQGEVPTGDFDFDYKAHP